MRTGVTYMGQHEARYIDLDFREMGELRLGDIFLALQENDFHYFPGKGSLGSKIAMSRKWPRPSARWSARAEIILKKAKEP